MWSATRFLFPVWWLGESRPAAQEAARHCLPVCRILKDMQQEELPDSELGEQQRRQLSSALLNLAVAASREGGIRDSVQFIKYTTALGQPPSLLMLQVRRPPCSGREAG